MRRLFGVILAAAALGLLPSAALGFDVNDPANDYRGDTQSGLEITAGQLAWVPNAPTPSDPWWAFSYTDHQNLTNANLDSVTVWYDTDGSDEGPEFRMRWLPPDTVLNFEYARDLRLRAVEDWHSAGDIRLCLPASGYVNYLADHERTRLPASCLGDPDRVRLHVRAESVAGGWDGLPGNGNRQWSRWLELKARQATTPVWQPVAN